MSLKDDMLDDLDAVWMDIDEFADTHTINGVDVVCIAEGRTNKEHIMISRQPIDGLSLDEIIVHVKKSDLPSVPEQGMRMEFDNLVCTVAHCDDDLGMLTITLQCHDAGGITYGY